MVINIQPSFIFKEFLILLTKYKVKSFSAAASLANVQMLKKRRKISIFKRLFQPQQVWHMLESERYIQKDERYHWSITDVVNASLYTKYKFKQLFHT